MRRKDLCPGPGDHPEAITEAYSSGDSGMPCCECPEQLLRDHLTSPRGRLIQQAVELDFAIQTGVTISLKEIPYPEFLLLRQIAEERNKYHVEEMKRKPEG